MDWTQWKRDMESVGPKVEDILDWTKWKRDMESVGLKVEDVLDRTQWKRDMESVGLKVEDVLHWTHWKRYSKLFWRPEMMGKAREEEGHSVGLNRIILCLTK